MTISSKDFRVSPIRRTISWKGVPTDGIAGASLAVALLSIPKVAPTRGSLAPRSGLTRSTERTRIFAEPEDPRSRGAHFTE